MTEQNSDAESVIEPDAATETGDVEQVDGAETDEDQADDKDPADDGSALR